MSSSSDSCHDRHEFTHPMQLQLYDGLGFPVDGTQFWVNLKIVKKGKKIKIQFPVINFQTGPVATNDPYEGGFGGGYIFTSDGYLPDDLRTADAVYHSYVVPSNNGWSLAFTYANPVLPLPVSGYILGLTFYGGIVISAAGTFLNLIAPGPQTMMPTTISYIVEPQEKLCQNFIIDSGASNITKFTNPAAASNGYRDSHVNDAFAGTLTWTWTSNANVPDKTNGTMNVFVAIAKMKDGKLKMKKPIQLSDLSSEIMAWDTAVTINRTDKNNMVVSYGVIDYNLGLNYTYRAVSTDGGKTWPVNGPTNIQPTGFSAPGVPGGFADNRGVGSDKFGNIWYSTANRYDDNFNYIDQPTFWISSNRGVTFSVAYTAPLPLVLGVDYDDFPQFCFGGDGLGNYGLWWTAEYYNGVGDNIPVLAFIPINGLGLENVGTPTPLQYLYSLTNTQYLASLTASEDGRFWSQSFVPSFSMFMAAVIRFKSPGPIDSNYAGPWQNALPNNSTAYGFGNFISYPPVPGEAAGYVTTVQNLIYDEKRQVLYSLRCQQAPDWDQTMRLYLMISGDNGQNWSNPYYIANTDFANRGYPSMSLDTSGALVFGWYDGRNDKTEKTVQILRGYSLG